ncbi:hypothetical protein GGX14DRAFT_532238 [Mycena pura]|uniref:Uncharacterized protein n=1 Tax=Mycena pura TaxID=153505 RepID=A0AAD6VTG6_9AGAR|nr:hypothetical protein GGX14DRAFT_532238 [Mycena pura]
MVPLPAPAAIDARMEDFQYIADTLAHQEMEQERVREPPISPEEMRIRLDQEFERILAKSLERELLEDGDDDDDEEFEQHTQADDFQVPPKDNAGFFPWPNETALLLDTMDNLGRCRFTGAQMSIILHVMKRLGARDIPSLKGLRKMQKQVHEGFGNAPVKVISPQGNIFYVSDLRQSIARDFANPLVAPHLNLYPEDVVDGPISERWQAERARDYDAEQLTPMFSDGQRRWWINEVARLHDGRFVIPKSWILRNGKLTSDVYVVTRHAIEDVWDCGGKEDEIAADEFEADLDELITEFGDFTWTDHSHEFVPAMPNPGRKLSGNRDLYVLGLSVWIDDVSGNKSKQYNKFLVMVAQNAALPGILLKQEFHIHFLGASQHVTTAELCAVLRDFVQGTEKEPIICHNAHTRREAAVILRVHDMDADNPQQSEEASHIGCNGSRPCRKCKWGGPRIEQVKPDVYHACHESGIARTADDIRSELNHQLSLATKGSAAAVEKRQTETGIKDKLTQYWIECVLARVSILKTENPGKSAVEIAAEAQRWFDEQPGDKMNPLLDIAGLDPARDTPVEILHTILLGVIKYIWHHLNTHQWSDTQRHLLAIRLQSTDISGMKVPPMRGAYMMQYRNNLIGKHFKTIMQTLTFHVHEVCIWEQFQLVKAAADLGARVWVTVIDNMDDYILELEIAIANVLDTWDATQESYNAVFRMCSINGNNQAPSRDIAIKFASMNNIKHALCGGFWESTASRKRWEQQPMMPREWLEPGEKVKRVLFDDPVLQRHLGWVTHADPVPGFVRLLTLEKFPPVSWRETLASQHWSGPSEPPPESKWRPAFHQVKVRTWVFVRDTDNKLALGRVVEILSAGNGRSWVSLERFICTEKRHPDFDWPIVRPPAGTEITEQNLTSYLVVAGSQLEFSCSVQHDCRMGHCRPAVVAKERQEREETTRDISLIKHDDDDSFVLNMGSTHNFVELTRALPPALYKLKLLHADRLSFHIEMAAKAKSARLTACEKAAEKRRETAAVKKQKAAEAAEAAEEAEADAQRAEDILAQELYDDESGSENEDESGEKEDEEDDHDYIPRGTGQKRGRSAQGEKRGGRKKQKVKNR